MKIFRPKSTEIDIVVNDDANCYTSLMDIGTLTLTFSLGHFEEFSVGCYADFEGIRYYLTKPENVTMKHSRNFEYTLTMFDLGYLLDTFKLRNSIDKRLKFSMTAKPVELLTEIVNNINDRSTYGWVVGDCVDGVEQTLTFSHNSVKEALNMLCDVLKTEYYLTFGDKITLNVKKAEFNKTDCPTLSYSCGNGFLSGVKRDCDTSSQEVFRLYVQGGESNIDFSTYGSPYLLLPAKGVCTHEDRTYKVSDDRYYIYNEDKGDVGYESSFDCAEVYPNRVGQVTTVEQEKTFYNIVDETILETLDYKACIMPGESLTLNFKSGMLAGRDIEATYEKAVNDMGDYYGGRFKLVPHDYDGVNMPGGVFIPKQGDEYSVFGISLPKLYVDDAEVKLLKESAKNMYENEFQKYNFTGELDAIHLKKNWGLLGSKIVVGGYILFTAPFTKKEGEKIRITGLKRYINDRYKIELTLSNGVASTSLGTVLDRVENLPTIVEGGDKKTRQFAKRRYEDAIQTAEMLAKALLDNFTNGITPISVQTMQMIVGSPQLQFQVYDDIDGEVIDFPLTWDKATKTLTVEPFYFVYYEQTKDLTSTKKELWWNNYRQLVVTLDSAKSHIPYYIYIQCHGEGNNSQDDAVVIISNSALPYVVGGYTNLLVGILNSEYEGDRSFAPMYGFTEITPDRITTNRIVSHNGLNFFDMLNNAMQLRSKSGNSRLTWDNGELEIIGNIKQLSGDGLVYEIGIFKGDYNKSTTYWKNDEVTYTVAGEICTYRYHHREPTSGNLPTDSTYWKIVARGATGATGLSGKDGADGKSYEFIFMQTDKNEAPAIPNSKQEDDNTPEHWHDDAQGVSELLPYEWACKRFKFDGIWSDYSKPALWAKYSFNGKPGDKGENGPPIVFRGDWKSSDTYYGLPYRLDVVKHDGTYYIARAEAGEFQGQTPSNNSLYWNNFGAQFSSVATGLLIAEMANIAGWNFYNDIIKSQNNTLDLDGKIGELTIKRSGEKVGKLDSDGVTLYGDANNPLRPTVKVVPGDIKELADILTDSDSYHIYDPKDGVITDIPSGTKLTMNWGQMFIWVRNINDTATYNITLRSGGKSITSTTYYVYDNNKTDEFYVDLVVSEDTLTVAEDGIITVEVTHSENVIYAQLKLMLQFDNSYGTVIGKNGMYSFMGNNRYFYISENQPPTIRNGNFGLMVADDGIKKWNGSNWVTANI